MLACHRTPSQVEKLGLRDERQGAKVGHDVIRFPAGHARARTVAAQAALASAPSRQTGAAHKCRTGCHERPLVPGGASSHPPPVLRRPPRCRRKRRSAPRPSWPRRLGKTGPSRTGSASGRTTRSATTRSDGTGAAPSWASSAPGARAAPTACSAARRGPPWQRLPTARTRPGIMMCKLRACCSDRRRCVVSAV